MPRRTSLTELHVALILLRFRAGKTHLEVSREAGVSLSAIGRAEAGLGERRRLEPVESLLSYYQADLALCHRLLLIARRHLGDLRQIHGPRMIPASKAQAIWADLGRHPDTSWIRRNQPPPAGQGGVETP